MTDARLPKRLPTLSRRRLWLSLIGAGLALVISSIALVLWFSRQAEDIHLAGQERAARLVASGLANAVYNDLITRDYGAIESRLVQAMSTENLLSVMLLDAGGKPVSHVRRDPESRQTAAVFERRAPPLPDNFSRIRLENGVIEHWVEVGQPVRLGALRVQLRASSYDSALMALQAQLTWILMGTGAGLTLILGLLLRQTYRLFAARESGLLQIQRHLSSVAYRDALTGLPNRHLLREHLQQMIDDSNEQGTGFAVCFLDLDEFKAVNDRLGHDAGDQLLVQVAQRLENSLRQSDIAFRLGGDEFVILLSNISRIDQARPILERIMATAQQPGRWNGQALYYGISMGVALYPSDATTPEDLVSYADRAMYAAKRAGKARWTLASGQENLFV